ncbi:MAG: adenylosuccinate synthetase, partial [Spirochaetes bacterium]|nr:adenylosuccinate synthetase [Spirochaetota bacterium]
TGYEIDREIHKDFTTHISSLKKVKPVYKTFPGWQENTSKISTFSELPENAKKYLNFMEDYLETPIYIVSTGPERDATIIKD